MLRKKAQRDTEYTNSLLTRKKVAEVFTEEQVKDKLITNAHKRVWKNIELASYLLQLGRNPRWVKRLLGLNRTTMKLVYELNTTAQ